MGRFAKIFTGLKKPDSPGPERTEAQQVAPQSSQSSGNVLSPAASERAGSPNAVTASSASSAVFLRGNASATSLSSSAVGPGGAQQKRSASREHPGRFELLEDGGHIHLLRNARRQEKLTRMLRDIMGTGSKVGNDAVSAVPEFTPEPPSLENLSLMNGLVSRVAKGEVEVGNVNGASVAGTKGAKVPPAKKGEYSVKVREATASMLAKYGKCHEVVGKGSYGTVRVAHKTDVNGHERLYAVKEFRKRSNESEGTFQDRLMSEFCISSQLRHPNIIETLDLMKDPSGGFCQVMEFCPGGDLYSLIISTGTGLKVAEADCFFKQLMRGVVYMHSMGVAHCDLKPENILLTSNGTIRISDFGNGECFRMAWEKDVHYSRGVTGSGPYIAPEEFKDKPFDPRAVDIWATGIIYMVMRTGSYLWRTTAPDEDDHYRRYLSDRKKSDGYEPIERLSPRKCVYVIYSILDPMPSRRITAKQVLNSEWGRSIRVCEAASEGYYPTIASAPSAESKAKVEAGAVAKAETEAELDVKAKEVSPPLPPSPAATK